MNHHRKRSVCCPWEWRSWWQARQWWSGWAVVRTKSNATLFFGFWELGWARQSSALRLRSCQELSQSMDRPAWLNIIKSIQSIITCIGILIKKPHRYIAKKNLKSLWCYQCLLHFCRPTFLQFIPILKKNLFVWVVTIHIF